LNQALRAKECKLVRIRIELRDRLVAQVGLEIQRQLALAVDPVGKSPPA
jgi:hypothetical protein